MRHLQNKQSIETMAESARLRAIEKAKGSFDRVEDLEQLDNMLEIGIQNSELRKTQLFHTYSAQVENAKQARQLIDQSHRAVKSIKDKLKEVYSYGKISRLSVCCWQEVKLTMVTLENLIKTKKLISRLRELNIEQAVILEVLRREDEFLKKNNAKEVKVYHQDRNTYRKSNGRQTNKRGTNNEQWRKGDVELQEELFMNIAEDLKVPKRKEIKTLIDVQERIHEMKEFRIEVLKHKDKGIRYMRDKDSFRIQVSIENMFDNILERYMQQIIYGVLPSLYPERIVMVVRIVFREEKYEATLPESIRSDTHFKPKQYRKQLFEIFDQEIQQYFNMKLSPNMTVSEQLKAIEDLFQDLAFYDDHCSELFPKDYRFIQALAQGYEATTRNILTGWTKEMDTISDIDKAVVYQWLTLFCGSQLVTDVLAKYVGGINNVYRYIDECEALLKAFKTSREIRMDEVINNIVKQSVESNKFREWESEDDQYYSTYGPSDLFNIIMIQIDPFKTHGEFFPIVIDIVRNHLQLYLAKICAAVKDELSKGKPNLPLVFALINDLYRTSINVSTLEQYIVNVDMGISIEWVPRFCENCDAQITMCLDEGVRQILKPFEEKFSSLFGSKEWKDGSLVIEICDKFSEIIDNVFEIMRNEDFVTFINGCGIQMTKWWLNEFLGTTKMTNMKKKELTYLKNDLKAFRRPFNMEDEVKKDQHHFSRFDSDSDSDISQNDELSDEIEIDLVHILSHFILMVEDQENILAEKDNSGFELPNFVQHLQENYYGVTEHVLRLFMNRTYFGKSTIESMIENAIPVLDKKGRYQYSDQQRKTSYFANFKPPESKKETKKSKAKSKKEKKEKKSKAPAPLHGIQSPESKSPSSSSDRYSITPLESILSAEDLVGIDLDELEFNQS